MQAAPMELRGPLVVSYNTLVGHGEDDRREMIQDAGRRVERWSRIISRSKSSKYSEAVA